MYNYADLGIGDAAGISPGKCPFALLPCHASYNSFGAEHCLSGRIETCSSAAAGLMFSKPFDTSFEAGLQELEMTTYKAVQGALHATGLQPTEASQAAVPMHALLIGQFFAACGRMCDLLLGPRKTSSDVPANAFQQAIITSPCKAVSIYDACRCPTLRTCALCNGLKQRHGTAHCAQVDIVLTATNMVVPVPSVSAMVAHAFGMRSDITTYSLGGQGCAAGVMILRLAQSLLRVRSSVFATTFWHHRLPGRRYVRTRPFCLALPLPVTVLGVEESSA